MLRQGSRPAQKGLRSAPQTSTSAELTEWTKLQRAKKKSQNFSVVFLLCGSLLKIDTAFTFCTWHKKKNLLFEGTAKAGGGATKWIASRQNIPFSTPLGPPHSHFTWLIMCGDYSENAEAWTAGSCGSTLEKNHKTPWHVEAKHSEKENQRLE